MSLNQSIKYLNKNMSLKTSGGYQYEKDKMRNANTTIKEVTGEHFFTKYGQTKASGFFSGNRKEGRNASDVIQYTIDDKSKVICFCQQRLGR